VFQQRLCDLELEVTRLRSQIKDLHENAAWQADYQDMFEQAPIGCMVLDEMGLVHEANLQSRRMLDPKLQRNIGGPFIRMVVKDNAERFLNHLQRAKTSPTPVSTDIVLRATDGRTFPAEMISSPVRGQPGKTRLFRTALLDLSARRQLRETLARTEHDLQALVDISSGIFWEADADTQDITFISRSAEHLLGYAPEKWYAPGFWHDHIHADDREQVTTTLARLGRGETSARAVPQTQTGHGEGTDLATGESEEPKGRAGRVLAFRMIRADRRTVWMHCDVTIRERDDKRKFSGVGVDITELKEREQELRLAHAQSEQKVAAQTAELKETVKQLETFSYSLSHDMRAPLRSMHGFCEILLDKLRDKIDPFEKDLLQRITHSAKRLDQLIQDVLHYSQVTRAPAVLKPMDLEKLLETMLRDYPSIQESGAQIKIKRPLLPVMGHDAFLTQCFSNLLSNAAKFVRPGEKAQIRVRTEAAGPNVRIWVEDKGIGINPEDQKRVFSIFQRFHSAPNLYEGSGLGLAIVQKAVERMHGRVGVESTPGEGSRFWFELPAAGTG
jgi:PAS domain S-box-containing protein